LHYSRQKNFFIIRGGNSLAWHNKVRHTKHLNQQELELNWK